MIVMVALLLVLFVWFIYFIYFRKLRACTWDDSWRYQRSIENALEADHPAKIVFILNNTLANLNRLGLTEYSPYSVQSERVNTKSNQSFMQTYGIPSPRKLKDAIDLAEEFCEQWEEITRRGGKAAQIQAMDRIKQVFSSEFFYLDCIGTRSNVYCKKDQKNYAYEWDSKVTSENIQDQWKTFDYNIGYYYKTGSTRTSYEKPPNNNDSVW